jgi:nucleotide-binding universal stress UspA family protein
MFTNIMLAVDGSEHGYHAAKHTGDMARAFKVNTVEIINVLEPVASYLSEFHKEQAFEQHLKHGEAILQKAAEMVGTIPGTVHTEVLIGSPAEEIIKMAADRKVDLIVMGSRGLGTLVGLLLGSQINKVISHAHCPVLVVR